MTPFIRMTFGTIVVAGALHMPFDAALAKKARVAKPITTDIADCAKLTADKRDACISLSRPVPGPAIYKQAKATPAEIAAAAASATKARAARFVAKVKKVVLKKDRPTNIADCAKLASDQRDRCISLSRPVKGADLAATKPSKTAQAVAAVTAVATVAKTAAAKLITKKDGTTDIADCAKVAPEQRDRCISLSRPVKGADLAVTKPSKTAQAVAAVTAVATAAKSAAAKLITNKDGTTNIADCAKVAPEQRDRCISLSRPVKVAETAPAKPSKAEKSAAAVSAAAGAAKAAAVKLITNKDGTTNLADCAKVAPEMRDRCISLSRPVKGADLSPKKASGAEISPELAAKAKAAAVKAVTEMRDIFRKGGTTDLADCARVAPELRDACISRSRPVKGPVSLTRG